MHSSLLFGKDQRATLSQSVLEIEIKRPFAQCVVSVHTELALEHLRYHLTDVPPQLNSLTDTVLN